MTNKIQNKRSSTLNNPPSSLDAGEIAINTNAASANIHFEDAGGDMRSVGADPTAAGTYVRNVAGANAVGTWVAEGSQLPGGGDGSGDYGFWNRDDGTDTLSPRTADDDLDMGAGDITTTGDISGAQGTYSAGVSITGGDAAAVVDGIYKTNSVLSLASHGVQSIRLDSTNPRTLRVGNQIPFNDTNSTYIGLQISSSPDPQPGFTNQDVSRSTESIRVSPSFQNFNSVHGDLVGYKFDPTGLSLGSTADFNHIFAFDAGGVSSLIVTDAYPGTYAAFRSDVSAGGNRFGTYMQGSATNYFAGVITVSNNDKFLAQDAGPGGGSGVNIGPNGIYGARDNATTSSSVIWTNRIATNQGYHIRFGSAGDFSAMMGIRGDGLNQIALVGTSDYRAKQDVVDISNASDVIKNLRPVSYSFIGDSERTHQGFIAHELQEYVPDAAFGDKDATEAIGVYTDAEGNVENDVVEPENIPFGASWSQTGVRDVMQTTDSSKLIPLLTKALQEALERIEALEEGAAKATTRKRKS